jgi:hypothetical protein
LRGRSGPPVLACHPATYDDIFVYVVPRCVLCRICAIQHIVAPLDSTVVSLIDQSLFSSAKFKHVTVVVFQIALEIDDIVMASQPRGVYLQIFACCLPNRLFRFVCGVL